VSKDLEHCKVAGLSGQFQSQPPVYKRKPFSFYATTAYIPNTPHGNIRSLESTLHNFTFTQLLGIREGGFSL
jgi:hypothetical protein